MINSSIITSCQFLFMSISLISMLTGEVFPVTDIMINGDQDSRVNIVFLGDGYTQEEMNDYIDDVGEVVEGLFSAVPYSNYINYFNVFAIEVPSNESGTDHPGTANDCGADMQIHILIVLLTIMEYIVYWSHLILQQHMMC